MTGRRRSLWYRVAAVAATAVAVVLLDSLNDPNSSAEFRITRITILWACIAGIPLAMIQHLCCPKTVNRRLSGWLELVGALTGVLIPLVYAAALSQADIAV